MKLKTSHSFITFFSIIGLFLTFANEVRSQTQVANFSTGKPGTDSYEKLSFWVEDGKRSSIEYTYGKKFKEIKPNYGGRDSFDGVAAFTLEFSNGTRLFISLHNTYIKVFKPKSKYSKIFRWEYVGPVNGRGTWCDSCTQDGKESVALLRRYYF